MRRSRSGSRRSIAHSAWPESFDPVRPLTVPPDAASISNEARLAFAAFERKEPYYDFEAGDWNVVARPVRADDTCLKCHWSNGDHWPTGGRSDLRVGDVLGVALYAYQAANQ